MNLDPIIFQERCNLCDGKYHYSKIVQIDLNFAVCYDCMAHIFKELYRDGKLLLKKEFNPSKRSS